MVLCNSQITHNEVWPLRHSLASFHFINAQTFNHVIVGRILGDSPAKIGNLELEIQFGAEFSQFGISILAQGISLNLEVYNKIHRC